MHLLPCDVPPHPPLYQSLAVYNDSHHPFCRLGVLVSSSPVPYFPFFTIYIQIIAPAPLYLCARSLSARCGFFTFFCQSLILFPQSPCCVEDFALLFRTPEHSVCYLSDLSSVTSITILALEWQTDFCLWRCPFLTSRPARRRADATPRTVPSLHPIFIGPGAREPLPSFHFLTPLLSGLFSIYHIDTSGRRTL
ncbi:hypothetical protein PLICRDRAFT_598438 [Plicaturopsis crispa FD-325 SS-3]|nr:hypothetical protein PLICRDRAFT_598438 [Plicaturopsis crispa FD-325 SS-3]